MAVGLGALLATACGAMAPFHPSTPGETAAGSPLGPSYILVPLPNEDDSLLGRVLGGVPQDGHSLDEVSRPNDCGDKLAPVKEGPLASTFEDGQELAAGGKARAALGVFGFEGDAQTATHFYYKLEVSKRIAQTDTTEYVACCKEKGTCGYGFVSALIYGDGQYATAAETSAEGNISIPIAGGANGFVKARVLHQRKVRGYVAALITVTNGTSSSDISVLGDPAAAGITLDEQTLPDQVKARFEMRKIELGVCPESRVLVRGNRCASPDESGTTPIPREYAYVFRNGSGEMTENEFIDRYRELVGSNDLDGAVQSSAGAVTVGATLLTLGLGGMVAGTVDFVASPNCPGSACKAAVPFGVGVGGGLGLALFGGIVLAKAGETPADHSITTFDADLYVSRYNRALLRQTIKETQTRMRELSSKNDWTPTRIAPVVSPGFVGITGQF